MPDLTLDEIERLRALEKAATPGPLKSHDFVDFAPGGHFRLPRVETENGLGIASAHDVGDVNETNANAALFSALRNAAPALFDMAREYLRLREAAQNGHVGALCEILGHRMIDDHCGKPEHRYCLRCDASAEEAPDA